MCLQKFFGDITRRKTVLLLSQVVGIPLAVVYLFQVGATACKRPILSLRTAAGASPFSKPAREKNVSRRRFLVRQINFTIVILLNVWTGVVAGLLSPVRQAFGADCLPMGPDGRPRDPTRVRPQARALTLLGCGLLTQHF